MLKALITLLIALCLTATAWPQEDEVGSVSPVPVEEDEVPGSEGAEPETGELEQTDEADEIDDSDLDEQTYEEDEYDFIPSEEIPADQPIPFPSNI